MQAYTLELTLPMNHMPKRQKYHDAVNSYQRYSLLYELK